ncbi:MULTISPECIES: flagellar motor switch protein FliN [Rhizobium]|jgi:flagellar motor switch protein FliN/FliY|uniref:Flagellar motor switch protein FliN n=1 Tax=Rhizobium leguminosarum bv. trifolii (strain WSM1325) TaxID=395491 RepID=C6B1D5_RHILS|nr:flagellar motor switch protein FliN [Rhizobium leguminosarum]ACS54654.1 flagellar motor switch protein FliN [Rhizobium leguminosarum bv. trifolii WSM1325]MBY2908913.1 flagellar motor switch protein FliN [Rhizobium leguminosarum]MBY2914519.1 flagellar motor switch protein FliN [Rhizobium leguminosarum]MBY2942228.1 flagellar motor switch protein FliN [Rhizobium leguminosarum]MBY2949401.1 flagellar motor switch protein FliN [Rhizobium leguminosarum]
MATKKTQQNSDLSLDLPGSEADLDQAIDDLRGVLKQDADGDLPQFGDDPQSDPFAAGTDLAAFGGEASESPFGGDDFGGDFGGSASSAAGMDFGSSPSFEESPAPLGSALNSNFDLIMDIPIDVQIMLGTSRMQVSGLMNLNEGATIALDKKIGEPVEIMVNGRRIARGEITVLDNDDTRFGVKLIEVLSTKKA